MTVLYLHDVAFYFLHMYLFKSNFCPYHCYLASDPAISFTFDSSALASTKRNGMEDALNDFKSIIILYYATIAFTVV